MTSGSCGEKNLELQENQNNLNIVQDYLPDLPQIVKKYQNIDYPESGIEVVDYTTDDLADKFQELTSINLENEDSSMLAVRRFNIKTKEIEVTDTQEFNLIKDFLEDGNFPELNQDILNIMPSDMGRIIMEGYRRYLKPERFITFNFHQVFELCHRDKNTWFYLEETHQKLMACFQILSKQYLENLDDRFKYLGCLIIMNTDRRKSYRLAIYLDKNGEICIPSIRIIKKKFFTMYNISMDKDIYLDFDLDTEDMHLIIDESRELVRYQVNTQGIIYHSLFPEYLNRDYLDEIKTEEDKHILEEN